MIRLHDIFEDSADSWEDFAFDQAIKFAFVGIVLFSLLYHLLAQVVDISRFPPLGQLFFFQLPSVVGGTGCALLGLRKSLREHGWRKVLDMPFALPCPNRRFYRELLKWTFLLVCTCSLLNAFSSFLLNAAGFHDVPKQLLEIFGADVGFIFWIAAFICAVVVAPVSEEILFRRVIYQGLKSLHFAHAGLLSAVLFSLCHGLPQAFLSYIFFSLVLQKACHKGSLWMAIGLHAGYNLIVFATLLGKIFFFSA